MLTVALALVASFLAFRYLVYPVFLSPLSKIPAAHPTAPFSDAWILRQRFKAVEATAIYEAHRKYGPVVRLGPNEVSVNSADDLNAIYASFDKWPWYLVFGHYGLQVMFSLLTREPHAARKRLINKVYTNSYLQSSSDVQAFSEYLIKDQFLPHLAAAAAAGKPVEVLSLMFAMSTDAIVAFLYGSACATNFAAYLKETQSAKLTMKNRFPFEHYNGAKPAVFWLSELPGVAQMLGKVGLDPISAEFGHVLAVDQWALDCCESVENGTSAVTERQLHPPTEAVVYQHLKSTMGSKLNTEGHPLAHHVGAELLDHTLAGYESLASCLTFLMWEMSRQPDLQSRLRAELRTIGRGLLLDAQKQEPLPLRELDPLPLLDAITKESLRRWAPIPTSLPRVTPPGGCVVADKLVPGGVRLPGGTRVSASAYSLHRNEDVFPEPEAWKPERWLKASGEERAAMDRWYWPFSNGSRMCIGKPFALQEMKLIIAAVYANFETSRTNTDEMKLSQAFPGIPTSGRCDLKFTRVE